ncbi:hypothetical protein EBT11_09880 [bacterium]|nr:hypothetical protein [bacterium]
MSYSVDVNLLVFASNEGSAEQSRAKTFLEERQRDPDLFCLTWPVLCGYQRIVTHPSIFRNPLDPGQAWAKKKCRSGGMRCRTRTWRPFYDSTG